MGEYRVEHDSLGEVKVPADALYGAQTQRAIDNFHISTMTMPESFIRALIEVKAAAAGANGELGLLSESQMLAIVASCEQLLAMPKLCEHFPIDVFQTGSATSSNMNANEVIARHVQLNTGLELHPNDHINLGQSSNDTVPTAIHVAVTGLLKEKLLPSIEHLRSTILTRAEQSRGIVKSGRTHLMDAMPVRMSDVFTAWSDQLKFNAQLLQQLLPDLQQLAQGGTAVGTGVNAHPQFAALFAKKLSEKLSIDFSVAENFFTRMGSQDVLVALSGALKTCAVSLMKIANDLRWMNSGPLLGLAEISLPALQPGSSIMPGKVNPVIPEAAAMVAAQVMGNDTTVTLAGQSGNFELNVMLPLLANNIAQSLELLASANYALADKAIRGMRINEEHLSENLARSAVLVTALNKHIGYDKAAAIAKRAMAEGRPILDVAVEQTDLDVKELQSLLDPQALATPK